MGLEPVAPHWQLRVTLANAEHDVLAYMAFDESLRSNL